MMQLLSSSNWPDESGSSNGSTPSSTSTPGSPATPPASDAAASGPSPDAATPPVLTAALDRDAWPDPVRDHSPLGVLLRFTAPPRAAEPEDEGGRRPLGVSLVIDRSGSMSGEPVEAAKEAAIRLQEHLTADDRRAVVAFDTIIDLVAPLGPAVPASTDDAAGRDRIARDTAAIRALHGRGGTALTEGWQTGVRLLEDADLPADADAIAVVLSDGMGNHGITDPAEMQRLAAAAASWGVRTTCVGIGRAYSTPQLEALCEGGEGTLHQASEPDEIVECVLGELGRVRTVSARDVRLEITVPGGLHALVVGGRTVTADRFDRAANARRYEVRLGDVAGERTVDLGVLLTRVRGAAHARELHFAPLELVARWTCAVTGERREAVLEGGRPLPTGVEPHRSRRHERDAARDHAVATAVLRLWHAWLIREATLRNERGDYHGAARFVEQHAEAFRAFARGLEAGRELVRTLRITGHRVRDRWEGRSKKELMVMSRKFARGEADLRAAYDVVSYADYVDRDD